MPTRRIFSLTLLATCAATLGCLQGAGDLRAVTDCMDAASPTVARTSSALVACFGAHDDPVTACAAQITACQAE